MVAYLEALSNLTNETLERQLVERALGGILVAIALMKGNLLKPGLYRTSSDSLLVDQCLVKDEKSNDGRL